QYDEPPPAILGEQPEPGWLCAQEKGANGQRYGIRLALADVKGINEQEIARIVAGRPYGSLADFWHRTNVSRPIVERLVLAGGFDAIYGIGLTMPVKRRGQVTRRDLLLQVADLHRWTRAAVRGSHLSERRPPIDGRGSDKSVRELAKAQSQAAQPVKHVDVQLALDLGDAPNETVRSG